MSYPLPLDNRFMNPSGTESELNQFLENALNSHFKTLYLLPCFIRPAKEFLFSSEIIISSVVGYPLGANTLETKVFETLNAVLNGADEIELVLNMSSILSHRYDLVKEEIDQVLKACQGQTLGLLIRLEWMSKAEILELAQLLSISEVRFVRSANTVDESISERIQWLKEAIKNRNIEVKSALNSTNE
ncbi:MAG: hypothetical protein KKE16_04645 [Firmicutes bacterium]|nr:hypothetical protein [Bacillota bacterium]